MIVPDEEKHFLAKIVDFGFAKAAEVDSRNMQKLTVTGDVFGSPLYMSPEQCKGQHVDHRSDIYALGCLMFEVLANDVPFMGDTAHHTMVLHVNTPPPDFNHSLGIPTWLRDIVWKALEKHPADRQQSAGEMKAALLRGMGVASSQTF
jgi:serine/threonine protein kinase